MQSLSRSIARSTAFVAFILRCANAVLFLFNVHSSRRYIQLKTTFLHFLLWKSHTQKNVLWVKNNALREIVTTTVTIRSFVYRIQSVLSRNKLNNKTHSDNRKTYGICVLALFTRLNWILNSANLCLSRAIGLKISHTKKSKPSLSPYSSCARENIPIVTERTRKEKKRGHSAIFMFSAMNSSRYHRHPLPVNNVTLCNTIYRLTKW